MAVAVAVPTGMPNTKTDMASADTSPSSAARCARHSGTPSATSSRTIGSAAAAVVSHAPPSGSYTGIPVMAPHHPGVAGRSWRGARWRGGARRGGEEGAAVAGGCAGTIYSLSTLSGWRLEDVKKASPGAAWFQLYLCGGRDVASATVRRARDVGYSALILTIDTAVAGLRERDLRNGAKELLTRKPWPMLPYVPQFLARPRWLADFFADGGAMSLANGSRPGGPMP